MTYDVIGSIAIIKFDSGTKKEEKKKAAQRILQRHPNIKTVLEKEGRVSGRLRTIKTRWIEGKNTREAEYRENGCVFRFNIEKCYFSPRLSEERKRIMTLCKKGEKILVMFGGVAPYAIVIAKNKPQVGKIVSVELGRDCNKYAQINTKINKVNDRVEIIGGDVKKVMPALRKKGERYDRIIMTRPNLKETFLKWALMVARKGTEIHYHGFSREEEREKMVEEIIEECESNKRRIKILGVSKAGDIAPRKYRYRVDLRVMN